MAAGKRTSKKGSIGRSIALFLLIFVFCIVFFSLVVAGWVGTQTFSYNSLQNLSLPTFIKSNTLPPPPPPPPPPLLLPPPPPPPRPKEYPLKCTNKKARNRTCRTNNYYPTTITTQNPINLGRPSRCPDYYRWIHEDLRPWRETGITREMLEQGKRTAHMRVVILRGRVYVEKYRDAIQTRDLFTLWGVLQLLRRYPGKLPDMEFMFDCDDRPVVKKRNYRRRKLGPPPLFRYCSDTWNFDIVFPDWSFWGWAEINIKQWEKTSRDIRQGNKAVKWKDRVPYAYWKGNPYVAPWRGDLLKCNDSHPIDWNTRLYIQDWLREGKQGFMHSNLEAQCTHRYKIYIEGWAWSVSEKYILACDSMTLMVRPRYHDFFVRGMSPLRHFWPIRDTSMCRSLKFAVHWGNTHPDQAEAIGRAASTYVHEDVRMELVYDYMFHLLKEYAKLLRFKPVIPPNATEICPEAMACGAKGVWKEFMVGSLVRSPSEGVPCSLPPPYEASDLRDFLDRKANLTRQVEIWEDEYWAKLNAKTSTH